MIEGEGGGNEKRKARSVLDFTFRKLDEVIADTVTDLEEEKSGTDRQSPDNSGPGAGTAHREEHA